MNRPSREIVFEGCFNFRDLGGYRAGDGRSTRWRRLFRSDHLSRLTETDRERMESGLGIATVLDLRDAATASELPQNVGANVVSLPLFDEEGMARMRPRVAEVSPRTLMRLVRTETTAEAIAAAFALLAEESSYPLVFHCLTGKDRTGLLAALVLGVLGVSDDDVTRDYAMTEHNMSRTIERLRRLGRLPAGDSFSAELPREFFETPPSAMRSLLRELRDQYGSVRGYVTSCGVDAPTLAGLERALLTGTDGDA